MGKQLSIYLPDEVMKRLSQVANKQCRRPHDQARYILLYGLGLTDEPMATNANDNTQYIAANRPTPEQI